jgi:SAM-dependent methyltransferase
MAFDDARAESKPRCPVCECEARLETSFQDIVLFRCRSCDHCFTDIAALDYLGEHDQAWEALHPNFWAHPNVALYEQIAKTIERHKSAARVIDIGSGRGGLLSFLKQRNPGFELTGLDVALQPDIPGVEILLGDVTTTDFGARRWDVVVSLQTIEHVGDVKAFVSTLDQLLLPDGLAIVSTIDDRSVLYAAARMLRRIGYVTPFERLYDRYHVNHFTSNSLRTLMDRAGFETLAHDHHNIPLQAVDMPQDSLLLRLGVAGTFTLGRLTRRTYEQTIVCRNGGNGRAR